MEGATTHRTADKDAEGVILFSGVGLYQQKTEQNQNRILLKVPRGGVELPALFNTLACPTPLKRSIEFHSVFLKLSHRFLVTSNWPDATRGHANNE
jgi:hypothetical protein